MLAPALYERSAIIFSAAIDRRYSTDANQANSPLQISSHLCLLNINAGETFDR
jgi:urease beta subunit